MAHLLGVFFTCLGLIALEIGITRVFSTMIWYQLSFLAISLAMLGFSLGGILLLVFPSIVRPDRENALPLCAFLFALSLAAGTLYIWFQPSVIAFFRAAFSLGPNRASVLYFVVMLLLFICAFVCFGLTLCTAISRQISEISRVYFANLLGSGLGCLLIIVLLSSLGAFKALLIVTLLATAASVCFMDRLRRSSPLLYGLNGVLILALLLPLFLTRTDAIFARSLFTRRDVTDENRLYRKWNSFSCVDFYKPEKESRIVYDGEQASAYYEGLWGLSRRYEAKMLDPIKVIIDSWAITSINKVEPDTLELDLYDYLPTNLAYQIKPKPILMQRFTLFLGQPIYSFALVLFSLLVFRGLEKLRYQRPGLLEDPNDPDHVRTSRPHAGRHVPRYTPAVPVHDQARDLGPGCSVHCAIGATELPHGVSLSPGRPPGGPHRPAHGALGMGRKRIRLGPAFLLERAAGPLPGVHQGLFHRHRHLRVERLAPPKPVPGFFQERKEVP